MAGESKQLSDSETAIDTSGSEAGESRSNTSNDAACTDLRVLSPHAVSKRAISWLSDSSGGHLLNESLAEPEQVFTHLLPWEGNEAIANSSPFSTPSVHDSNESMASRGGLQMISPGPGIGGWLQVIPERARNEHGQRVYIVTPLRLSAEYQHARGKMVEHMLIPDRAYSQLELEQDRPTPS